MSFKNRKPALLLVDIQQGLADGDYYGGNRNNPDAEAVSTKVLATWRSQGLPIYHVRHSSTNPASPLHASKPGFAFHEAAQPQGSEPEIVKNVNSAFIGTDLKERLDAAGIDTVVIVGLTTNHCISTTTRMAGNLGFNTYLVADATATFDRVAPNGQKYDSEVMHQTTLASLHEEFATVVNSDALLGML